MKFTCNFMMFQQVKDSFKDCKLPFPTFSFLRFYNIIQISQNSLNASWITLSCQKIDRSSLMWVNGICGSPTAAKSKAVKGWLKVHQKDLEILNENFKNGKSLQQKLKVGLRSNILFDGRSYASWCQCN